MGNATSMPESEIGKVLGKNLELVGPVRGGVNRLLSTLQHALREERHFALVDGFSTNPLGNLCCVF